MDDEPGFLLAVKKILQRPSVLVDTADTLKSAMALLQEIRYHVVVSDIMLTPFHEDEGFAILRFAKDRNPVTKVILLTAYGGPDVIEKARRLGADLFLEKPVASQMLIQALERCGIEQG